MDPTSRYLGCLGRLSLWTARSAAATILLSLACARAADLRAAVVHLHAGPGGANVVDAAGAALANGREVRVGFLPDAFNFAGLASKPAEVGSVWQALGSTSIRPLFGQSGRYAATAETADRSLVGRTLYIWILNSSDGLPITSTYSNVASHALFSSSNSHWRLPSPEALPPANSVILALAEADRVFVGVKSLTALALAGVAPPVTGLTFDQWATMTITSGDRSALGNRDSDRFVNLLEFVLGTNPLKADDFNPIYSERKVGNKTYLEMTFVLPSDRMGATWVVEVSGDLKTWVMTPHVTITDQGNGTKRVVARDTLAREDSTGSRFIRVNVSL